MERRLGVACLASNWGAMCLWDRVDSEFNPAKLVVEQPNGGGDYVFIRETAYAKRMLKSLEGILPGLEKQLENASTSQMERTKIEWLRNLRGRLMQLVKLNPQPDWIESVEKLSDKFSHEINREEYRIFITRSNNNRRGANKKPCGAPELRKRIKSKFKTPTPPPLQMVRDLIKEIEEAEAKAEEEARVRKVKRELEGTIKNKKVERLQKQATKLQREKEKAEAEVAKAKAEAEAAKAEAEAAKAEAEAVMAEATSPTDLEIPVVTTLEKTPAEKAQAVAKDAMEIVSKVPVPDSETNNAPANFLLRLASMGTMGFPADAVIRRTQEAIEVVLQGAPEPLVVPCAADMKVDLFAPNGAAWPLLPGATISRAEEGQILYDWA